MGQIKRKSSFDSSLEKKLRSKSAINCIENLPNEIFYEIFDYLDAWNIYNAFSSLNYYFNQLFNCSLVRLKVQSYYPSSNDVNTYVYNQIMLYNRYQIYSIDWLKLDKKNEIISTIPFDVTFDHLESLILESFEPKLLHLLLPKLIDLPRLFSLTMDTRNTSKDLGEVYQLVFRFTKLKRFSLSANNYKIANITISLPRADTNQISPIECLIIHHPFTFKELSSIISYTRQLSRLEINNESEMKQKFRMISSIILSNLIYIFIDIYRLNFKKFEGLITKIHSKLKVLSIHTISYDKTYLDAHRWEELIKQYLPQLEKFYLKYYVHFEEYSTSEMMYRNKLNQFFSSFWIERQWILDAEIDSSFGTYFIRPYRQRWYEKNPHDPMITSSDQLSKSMQFILAYILTEEDYDSLCPYISDIGNATSIYHLTNFGEISVPILIRILFILHELDSLLISTLLLSQQRSLDDFERTLLEKVPHTNRITKVNLGEMNDIEEVYFLIDVCPHLTYLQVDNLHQMDMELFVRLIFKKMNTKSSHQLRLLSFAISAADDPMIKQLNKMIDDEKLLFDYTIKRVLNHIYLQWN